MATADKGVTERDRSTALECDKDIERLFIFTPNGEHVSHIWARFSSISCFSLILLVIK